ncbi:hypothetical protein R6Q59_010930 [Mikania micrantha]|uniref:Pectinesterase n=1 Tax=Mikania micrantha TaxID=192012 RepID=A0A5N6N4T2_9ASTR|nr:hypothetical protein E3N88_25110 [Mikania micrantha]
MANLEVGKKKKATVIAIATMLVVAAVVGTIIHVRTTKDFEIRTEEKTGVLIVTAATVVTATTIIILCKYTDFRDICRETLDRIKTSVKAPRDLIKASFSHTVERIQFAIDNSLAIRQAAKDPRAAMALDQCKELLNISIDDLKRSISRLNLFDVPKLKDNTVELRVWLSGSVTYQQTCLDAFDNTTGESGLAMARLLDIGIKLTRNSLAMVDGIIELAGGKPPRSILFPRGPLDPSNTVIDGNLNPSVVPQPKPRNFIFDWRFNRNRGPEVPQPKPKTGDADWKIDEPELPQPNPKTINADLNVDKQVPQPKPNNINFNWKKEVTITHSRTDGSKPVEINAGNRRMLDQTPNEEREPSVNSKLQMVGDTSDNEQIIETETNTPYPSWADTSRRSLINADPGTLKPNAVVAQDGSGNFRTITEAVATAPQKSAQPFVILIKAGVYKENVEIPRRVDNVVLLGEGPTKTKITGSKNYVDGTSTFHTATVAVNGDGFMARGIAFENTAGPDKHQAVALRVSADMSIFHNCAMDAYQDTLYTHSYRQFYRQCTISGTIDFIFGNAAAVFQDCKMIVRKPMNNQACMVTAQGRKDQHSVGGLVLDGCTITAEPEFMNAVPMPKSYLGRPWKEFSRTIIMQSFIDKNIDPEGWAPWVGTFGLDTCFYAEVNNKGPGADTSKRVTWKGVKKITRQEAANFAPGIYIQGDTWIKGSSVPYDAGLMRV